MTKNRWIKRKLKVKGDYDKFLFSAGHLSY